MQKQGFTTFERIIAVLAVAIGISIVGLYLYNSNQVGSARNAERKKDVRTILDAIYQYSIDQGGRIPDEITTDLQMMGTATEGCSMICAGEKITNDSCLNLNNLLVDKYIITLPLDPNASTDSKSYYAIKKTEGQRLYTVSCLAENDVMISASR